ncbi:MAG: hypothetical protein PVJ31_00870 [Methyloceanibacter sp.]
MAKPGGVSRSRTRSGVSPTAVAGAGRDVVLAPLAAGVGARLVRAGAVLVRGAAPAEVLAPDGFWTGLSTVTSTGGSS